MTIFRGDPTRVRKRLRLVANQALTAGQRVGVLATVGDAAVVRDLPVVLADLGREGDAETAAARLYAALRELDAARVDRVLARDISRNDGLWRAIGDRLRRAATTVVEVADE